MPEIYPLIHLPSPFLTDEKTLMPLGLLYIGASIEHAGKKCVIIDLAGVSMDTYIQRTIQALEPLKFSAVGIGITTSQAPIARNLSKELRKHFPGVRIVVGGPHVTHCLQAVPRQPERTKKVVADLNDNYDVLVMGDSERAIFPAFEPNAPKIINATTKLSPYYVDEEFLDNMPFPARHLIDVHSYHYNLGHSSIEETNAINIMSQRGCPYACRFCASRMDKFGRTIRRTGPKKVVEEVEFLYKTYGYTDFTFYDDELNVDPDLGSLLNQLKDLQMKVGQAFRFR